MRAIYRYYQKTLVLQPPHPPQPPQPPHPPHPPDILLCFQTWCALIISELHKGSLVYQITVMPSLASPLSPDINSLIDLAIAIIFIKF